MSCCFLLHNSDFVSNLINTVIYNSTCLTRHSVYLRGQFTFHKNEEKVNNVWRKCEYLSDLVSRYKGKVSERGARGAKRFT